MKILIVEDEKSLQESIHTYLSGEGYECQSAFTLIDAEEQICLYIYDCVLIDVNLPDGSGLDLIQLIKARNSGSGIIIISARERLDDRFKGLNLGADDYMVKPFHLSELNARIFSLLRRIQFRGNDTISFREINISPSERKVEVNNEVLELTKKEYDLLLYLISNEERVLSKESICEYLWGEYADASATLDFVYTHIKNLRKKIMEKGGNDYISTVYGVGYKLTDK